MMGPAILIRGGRVLDPGRGLDATGDVLVEEGIVRTIETAPGALAVPDNAITIDAEGCIVTPGLIDPHVHLREPDPNHEETIATGAASAVAGGFTTVACMPNTNPPLDTPAHVTFVHDRAAEAGSARVYVVACATVGRRGEHVADLRAMAEAGAVGFSDDGDCIASAGVMDTVLRAVAATGTCFMQHCQDPTLTVGAAMNAGPVADALDVPGWPAVAEEIIIERDVRLNRDVACRYHAQHVSSGGSIEILRAARRAGQPVTGEVSPHHLLLTDDDCGGGDTNYKMNPPLRTRSDIELLKAGVADGTITVLATDHAPHPAARKTVPFAEAAFGIVGLECALPLYVEALIDGGVVDWPRLVDMMSRQPADLLGLGARGLGTLTVGGTADVTVIDPDERWTIDAARFRSAGRNCPFHGRSVRGRAIATIVGGQLRHQVDSARMAAP